MAFTARLWKHGRATSACRSLMAPIAGLAGACCFSAASQQPTFAAVRPPPQPDVLVIGGTGLMGAPTTRALQQQGHRVVVMSRSNGTGGRRPTQASCDVFLCDREDSDAFAQVLARADCPRVIVDFTAMNSKHIDQIITAHRRRPLQHYVFISTNMVYPGGPEVMDITALKQPVQESAADAGIANALPKSYGGWKLRCEAALQQSARDDDLPWTTLRPPAVVGPGCDDRHERLQRVVAGLTPLPPRRSNRPATARPGLFRVAYSGDVAQVVASVVAKGDKVHGEVFNIASTESMTLVEYMEAMAVALGTKAPALSSLPEEDQGLRNYERQAELDISKAQRLLNFQPTPIHIWMAETVEWHRPFLTAASLSSKL